MSDELSIEARGRRIAGWTHIAVTLSCDAFPGHFSIGMTWRDAVTGNAVIAAAGDECKVFVGKDQVLQGYIDTDSSGGDARGRFLRLSGRGKTQDLTDCCAEIEAGQVMNGDVQTISKTIASAYDIEVALINGAKAGPKAPQWAVNLTEHGADIIQRLAKNAGLLAYEDAKGRLVLSEVGTTRAASGPSYGKNVESWGIDHSMHERFSIVRCALQSVDMLSDVEGSNFFAEEKDPNVPRHRVLVIPQEEYAGDAKAFTIKKAKWEVARRYGRSTIVTATVDSWRDEKGALWAPNTIVPVDLPASRLDDQDLVLVEVTFRLDSGGTHADLVLMPREALTIEPVNLLPTATADLERAGQ